MRRRVSFLAGLMVLGLLIGGAVPSALSSDGYSPSACCEEIDTACGQAEATSCCWTVPAQCCPPSCCCSMVIDHFSSLFGFLCGASEGVAKQIYTPAGAVLMALVDETGTNRYYVGNTLVYLAPGEMELDLSALCCGAKRVEVVLEDTTGAGNTVVTARDAQGNIVSEVRSRGCVEEVLAVDFCDACEWIAQVEIKGVRTFVKEIRIIYWF